MNAWIVYAVGFSQIVVLYFLALPYCLRMTYSVYLGKNRQWVEDNEAFRQRYPEPKYSVWLSFLVGIGLLVFFFYKLFISNDASWQIDLLTTSMLPFCVVYVCHAVVECFRVRKKIPLPTKRTVVLERRSLASMINPKWVYGGYLMVAIAIGAYCAVFYEGRIDAHVAKKAIWLAIWLALMTAILTIGLIYTVQRKKQSLDEMWGPSYRRGEVITFVVCLYVFAIGSTVSALQYLFGVHLFSHINMAFGFSVLIQAGMFYLGRHAWPKHSSTPNSPTPSITT